MYLQLVNLEYDAFFTGFSWNTRETNLVIRLFTVLEELVRVEPFRRNFRSDCRRFRWGDFPWVRGFLSSPAGEELSHKFDGGSSADFFDSLLLLRWSELSICSLDGYPGWCFFSRIGRRWRAVRSKKVVLCCSMLLRSDWLEAENLSSIRWVAKGKKMLLPVVYSLRLKIRYHISYIV